LRLAFSATLPEVKMQLEKNQSWRRNGFTHFQFHFISLSAEKEHIPFTTLNFDQ